MTSLRVLLVSYFFVAVNGRNPRAVRPLIEHSSGCTALSQFHPHRGKFHEQLLGYFTGLQSLLFEPLAELDRVESFYFFYRFDCDFHRLKFYII